MKFTFEQVEDIVTKYTAGKKVFEDFEFTRAFMNHVRMFKDDDFVAEAFYRYAINIKSDNREYSHPIARACEDFEDLTKGASFIEVVQDNENEYGGTYVQVVKHVPSGLYMKHECYAGSYGNGYDTDSAEWVQVYPKERIEIDFVE